MQRKQHIYNRSFISILHLYLLAYDVLLIDKPFNSVIVHINLAKKN